MPSAFLVFSFLLFLLSAFFSIRIFPSASAIGSYPVRVLQTPNDIPLFSIPGSSFAASTSKRSAPAPAPTPAAAGPAPAHSVASATSAQAGQGRLQHDSIAGPPPTRYVNYLAYQGYSVEIIGGKHYKTPDGEFVELKSGTQYKIHVKNSHAYSKDAYLH